jgi:hypothetical protein
VLAVFIVVSGGGSMVDGIPPSEPFPQTATTAR